jgi:hypothetical protein
MRINGEWYVFEDDVVRPVVQCEVQKSNGDWETSLFLLDTGADRTVFSRVLARALTQAPAERSVALGGVGGLVEAELISTVVRLTTERGSYASFRGEFPAAIAEESLDISVLGRDILSQFAAIVDFPKRLVSLLAQLHDYRIIAR